ncbi:hypothetical protein [Kribbella sp. NBC_00889]|uniref:hypothetical protein n=1 Tax=Kribbella sp. NBC_00889 TaxID=2975974 RepID=UPI00386427D9|nr:hypothetical protein OG817_22170 [Kribbella sp. NBC_00889]
MPGATPNYGWPYQLLSDAPDGPDLGKDLAEAIDTTLKAVDTAIQAELALKTDQATYKGGRSGFTTDASGRATITHGMGGTPVWVVLTSDNTGTYWVSLVARTATTFTVQVNSKDAGVLVSSAFTVHWFAGLV